MTGIDVSKATLSCAHIDPDTRKLLWKMDVNNTPAGQKKLLRRIPQDSPIVIEPTGRYGQEFVRAAYKEERDVRLALPKKAQHFLKSVQDRAKTDTLDAIGLALYGLAANLPAYPLKSDMHEEIDQLLAARKGLSQSLMQLQAQQRDLPRAAKALKPAVSALKKQRDAIDKKLALLSNEPELSDTHRLMAVPGIGPVTALTVASCLTARSFSHPDKFVAYCGLDIRVRQSGIKKGSTGLSKQGESELRRLLYLAARASLRSKNSPFKAHYQREREKGLPSTAAICVVSRKMAKLCWSLVKHQASYDSQRVYTKGEETQKKADKKQ